MNHGTITLELDATLPLVEKLKAGCQDGVEVTIAGVRFVAYVPELHFEFPALRQGICRTELALRYLPKLTATPNSA